ncbi:carbohydrate ABC transporter permease [bacterium]|nr:MAG: carbohydrate ABC transporter permease [bacterium]
MNSLESQSFSPGPAPVTVPAQSPESNRHSEQGKSGSKLPGVLRTVALCFLSVLFLLPFYLLARNALLTEEQIQAPKWLWLPTSPQFSNFIAVFNNPEAPLGSALRNSATIAITTLVFQMLISSMAGYALARIPARGKNVVFGIIVATLMIPGAVTFVPSYAVIAALGGVNHTWGIIVPGLFSAFSIFLFRQFYLRFPTEIEEAGRLDGLSYFGVYWRLLLPNSLGILMALGVLCFIGSWNSFVWPLIVGQDTSTWTVQVVLSTFITAQKANYAQLFAAAFVGVLPLVVVFLAMQRYIVEGAKFSSGKE